MERSLKSLCLAAALATASAFPLPAAATVSWVRIPPGCAIPPEMDLTEMPCGGHGTLFFGAHVPPRLPTCNGLRFGTEEPPAYLAPGTPQPAAGIFPCQGGSCFSRGHLPWVAVLDWDQPHGWTVGAVIRETSDRRAGVELFDLEDPAGTLPDWLVGVGDAHVLAQLCRLAELVSHPGVEAPLAVNMSFGRSAAKTPAACQSGGEGTLECEIRGVLGLLRSAHGIVPIASAGNHGDLLFPAEDAGVLSAGALALSRFADDGGAEPSNETPPEAEALVPGYGLYLENPYPSFWPAPPGSSYASAFLAGWLAGILAERPELSVDPGGSWTPMPFADGYLLAHDGLPLPGSDLLGPARLLDRALGSEPAACVPPVGAVTFSLSRSSLPPPPLPDLSLVELVAQSNQQQPGAVICVPCHGDQPPSGLKAEAPLAIDLRSSPPLPAQYRLTGIYLRIGATRYRLDGSNQVPILGQMAQGAVDTLILRGFDGMITPGQQVSLVYTLTDLAGTPFWDATPVNVHEH